MTNRASGVLMHITSLPGNYGIGTMGKEGKKFIDFLSEGGQKYWQILPVGPTGFGNSPYQAYSAFAGNPFIIDLEALVDEGYITLGEINGYDLGTNPEKVDYDKIIAHKIQILKICYGNFAKRQEGHRLDQFKKHHHWIEEYSVFMALKEVHQDRPWYEWSAEYKERHHQALEGFKASHRYEIEFWVFLQWVFYKQWLGLKAYANKRGVEIIGDMPIYVSGDSADTWAHTDLFCYDDQCNPVAVAGCPPDAFSATGQLWGNPLYDWSYNEKTGFEWWIKRMASSMDLYDIIRIDHFRGFESYWEIPAKDETAEHGRWVKGPGMKLFNAINQAIPDMRIIAEDLGFLTEEVLQLVEDSGYPGMKVLQFAFDSREESDYLPHNYNSHCIVYTGTHDNDTVMGWFDNAAKEDVDLAKDYLALSESEGYNWGFIRGAWSSVAEIAIAPMQDFLGLGTDYRMNIPSTIGGNWEWRVREEALSDQLAKRMYKITKMYGRLEKKMFKKELMTLVDQQLMSTFGKDIETATKQELYFAVSKSIMVSLMPKWRETEAKKSNKRQAYYLSAEFLMGRAFGNNLISLGLQKEMVDLLATLDIDLNELEECEEDAGLGNGGLGRLAACFIDSAASLSYPLTGYGIRYEYGIFKQKFENGEQVEFADEWLRNGNPWSLRRADDTVEITFADTRVSAVPYDYPVIGYRNETVNTLRLWRCEPLHPFDFKLFNDQDYDASVEDRNRAEDISRVLYPNDSTEEGKILRLKQQYFFVSASLQDMLRKHKAAGRPVDAFHDYHAVQLNDTHPVIAIPELMRLLMAEGLKYEEAWAIVQKTFAYTNHTILSEALEKWSVKLMKKVLPEVYKIIQKIDTNFQKELKSKGYSEKMIKLMSIIQNKMVHMAWLAIHGTYATNGVAQLHTDLLKTTELKDWYNLYPERFHNKTNGITQRRWLFYSNPELTAYITSLMGSEEWMDDLTKLKALAQYADDQDVLATFMGIKNEKKKQLKAFIQKEEGIVVDEASIFDIQIKRLHEYKRQLLNAFHILDLYYRIKENPDMKRAPQTFIFGAKAAPGYLRAKGIIKFINQIADLVNHDPEVNKLIKVVFVQNYRVTYGEKLFTAADISEQISTAGKEASGTGNMKFMLNGTPTIGTYDGANVEIVAEAGFDNNFIFGARVEALEAIKETYDPKEYYNKTPGLKRVIDALIDGTFDDEGTGYYQELYDALMVGAEWHKPDHYFILKDFEAYRQAQTEMNRAYQDTIAYAKKCWLNMCYAGKFSSDRTIEEYVKETWRVEKI
jgi:starch phosphorylase